MPKNSNERSRRECAQQELANRNIKKILSNVMIEILPNLPTESITRFRSLSRPWHASTYEPSFALQQFKNGPDLSRIGWSCHYSEPAIKHRALIESVRGICHHKFIPWLDLYSWAQECCHGKPWNLGKIILLPEGTIIHNISKLFSSGGGLGFDISMGEYNNKAVQFVHFSGPD